MSFKLLLRLLVLKTVFSNFTYAENSQKVNCVGLVNQFCEKLWDDEHRGNINVLDGEIKLGKSRKSNYLTEVAKIDLQALIKAQKNFPKDLKAKSTKLLNELKTILISEEDSKFWIRKYKHWQDSWTELLSDVADDRAKNKNLALFQRPYSEKNWENEVIENREYYKLFDEVTLAKYSHHENWYKLQKNFTRVKELQLEEISSFSFPDDFKNYLLERTQKVELVLPFRDIDTFDGSRSCAEDEVNALYSSVYNKLTVCIGLLNGVLPESSTFFTLSHELSHAIDPGNYVYRRFIESGLRQKSLEPLIGIKDQPMPCEEWAKIKDSLNQTSLNKEQLKTSYDKLAYCLDNKKKLRREFNIEDVDKLTEDDVFESLNSLARDNAFTMMLVPNFRYFEKERNNPFYLHPEIYLSSLNKKGYFSSNRSDRVAPRAIEVFYQELQCGFKNINSETTLGEYFKGSDRRRSEIFKSSIETTRNILSQYYSEYAFSCGQYCSDLVKKGMARQIDEKFADWLSYKVYARYLEKEPNLSKRQKLVSSSVPVFCDRPGITKGFDDFKLIEKTFSYEEHPDHKDRIKAIFNKEISQLLNCESENKDHWGSCEVN